MRLATEQIKEAPVPGAHPQPASDVQQLWFTLQARPWNSLAVVPSHRVGSSARLAHALVEVGQLATPGKVELLDAEGAGLEDAGRLVSALSAVRGTEKRLVVVLESVLYNQVSIPIARAADAVLICVDLGSDLPSAERTVELIGEEGVLGTVAVRGGAR